MKTQVEQLNKIGVGATAIAIGEKKDKEDAKNRKYEIVCKMGFMDLDNSDGL